MKMEMLCILKTRNPVFLTVEVRISVFLEPRVQIVELLSWRGPWTNPSFTVESAEEKRNEDTVTRKAGIQHTAPSPQTSVPYA